MNPQMPGPLSRPRTVVLGVLFLGVMISGGRILQHGITPPPSPPVNGGQLFESVHSYLSQMYVDTIGDDQIYRMAVDGLMGELNDPYNAFLPKERLQRLAEQTSGNYAGIGLQVDVRDGNVVVVNPLPGGPGERAGVLTGDRIAEIDGRPVHGWMPEEVQRLLRGKPGSSVTITVQRPGSADSIPLKLTRAPIHQSAIRHAAVLPNAVGYIDLQVFSDSTDLEVARAVDSLLRVGARSLLIDLRANPGGVLEQGVRVADLFLDPGQHIVRTRGRVSGATQDYVDHTPQRWPQLPVTVLVDERTASAAELFAGALQDHDRAVILGLTTYGKGSAQNVYPVDGAGALALTTARWYTPSGRSISYVAAADSEARGRSDTTRPKFKTDAGRTVLGGGGITPDVVVGDTSAPPENIAFMHALGRKVGTFRDALASYALALKASRAVTAPNFVVTPVMREEVYRRMQERGVAVLRPVYDAAGPLVSRLLGYEVARYVFGADAEFRRKAADDKILVAGQRLMAGVRTQHDALDRAQRMATQLGATTVAGG